METKLNMKTGNQKSEVWIFHDPAQLQIICMITE